MGTIMLKVSPRTIGPNSSRLHSHMAQNILFEILLVCFSLRCSLCICLFMHKVQAFVVVIPSTIQCLEHVLNFLFEFPPLKHRVCVPPCSCFKLSLFTLDLDNPWLFLNAHFKSLKACQICLCIIEFMVCFGIC